MSINYAILGLLSDKSMSGYDLKKIIQDSEIMPWSGNNNQIYKALTELHGKGLVTNEVMYQESSPTKKIYTITSEGLDALKKWVLSPVETSEIKKPFLLHLAFAKQLDTNELNELIDGYEKQVEIQLLMSQNYKQDTDLSGKTDLEITLRNFIDDNIRRTYENELRWIQDLRRVVALYSNTRTYEDKDEMINEK